MRRQVNAEPGSEQALYGDRPSGLQKRFGETAMSCTAVASGRRGDLLHLGAEMSIVDKWGVY